MGVLLQTKGSEGKGHHKITTDSGGPGLAEEAGSCQVADRDRWIGIF